MSETPAIIPTPVEGLTWQGDNLKFEPHPEQKCCRNCAHFDPFVVPALDEESAVVALYINEHKGFCVRNAPVNGENPWPAICPWRRCGEFTPKPAV